jgi:hypothetical protein
LAVAVGEILSRPVLARHGLENRAYSIRGMSVCTAKASRKDRNSGFLPTVILPGRSVATILTLPEGLKNS